MKLVFNLLKARSHKYISRKKDAKGNWVYTYQEDKQHIETINQIKKEAKKHSGMEFSMETFRYSFFPNSFKGMAEKAMNQLLNEGVFVIKGKFKDGSIKYAVA